MADVVDSSPFIACGWPVTPEANRCEHRLLLGSFYKDEQIR
jgi:hypothetical protein